MIVVVVHLLLKKAVDSMFLKKLLLVVEFENIVIFPVWRNKALLVNFEILMSIHHLFTKPMFCAVFSFFCVGFFCLL